MLFLKNTLPEGSTVLVSRHGSSQVTRFESFILGRTFTARVMWHLLDTPICHRSLQTPVIFYLFFMQTSWLQTDYVDLENGVFTGIDIARFQVFENHVAQ